MTKKLRTYTCPYCNKVYNDNKWTDDHIIPRAIGGTKSFKIVSCFTCNNKICSEIEQPALQTLAIRGLFGGKLIDGHNIRARRRKNKVNMHETIGFSGGRSAKMYYDLQKKTYVLSLQGSLPGLKKIDDMEKITHAIIPIDQPAENEAVLLAKLTNKIIYGTCVWLWEDKFLKSDSIDLIKNRMWKVTNNDILELKPTDKHYSVEIKDKDSDEKNSRVEDALNNSPNHTIAIFNKMGYIYGILNLFGKLESSCIIGKKELFSSIDITEGIVIITSTIENKIKKMALEEYENFKKKELS